MPRSDWRRVSASVLALAVGGGLVGAAQANEDVLRLQEEPGFNVMPSITYNGWNYSELDQINRENVAELRVDWTFQLGVQDRYEAPPLVVGETMYIITPKPNHVYAIDLNEQRIKWEYRPEFPEDELNATLEVACCGAQTRGLNYAEGKLFMQTLSGRVIGLDAETGEQLWMTKAADQIYGETTTGNGIVVGNLYIIGSAGGEFGARGSVTAFDIDTGNIRWKYYNMGPNNEVGIGERFRPFYADDQIENPALDSWYADSWKRGGGTVWGYFTYDPELNMIHYSTGNCGPWNPDYRREWGKVDLDEDGGLASYRNNYCASQMARDATTGELIWAYNIVPQDAWDLDQPLITPLVDLEIDGETRKVALKAARNGYFYVWDRETGEIVNDPWPFVYVDFMTGVDKETGRALYDIDKIMFTNEEDRRQYTQEGALTDEERALQEEEAALYAEEGGAQPDARVGTEVSWCPGISARNWENDAYSPKTGLLYTPVTTDCRIMRVTEGEYVVPLTAEGYRLREYSGEPFYVDVNGNPTEHKSELQANDPVTGETVWRIEWPGDTNRTPVLATAGDVLFQGGENTGTFRAIDATNGDILYEFRTGSRVKVTPVTYLDPNGDQKVAIILSSAPGDAAVAADAPPDAASRYTRSGATLYVFGLARQVVEAN